MKATFLMFVVAFVALVVPGCGQKTTLTVSPEQLQAGGGSVTVSYKTEGYLGTAGFALAANPPQSGFPIVWTGNTSGSVTVTVKSTTTFTITTTDGTMVTSKTVSVL
jgi:hypothetical protein